MNLHAASHWEPSCFDAPRMIYHGERSFKDGDLMPLESTYIYTFITSELQAPFSTPFACPYQVKHSRATWSHGVRQSTGTINRAGIWSDVVFCAHDDRLLWCHMYANVSIVTMFVPKRIAAIKHANFGRFFYYVQYGHNCLGTFIGLSHLYSSYPGDSLRMKSFVSQLQVPNLPLVQ